MNKFIVLHGVNLNMFGLRDASQYGTITLDEINCKLQNLAQELGIGLEIFQTNHEGEMIEKIHGAVKDTPSGVAINAGAWSHYSYALADALSIIKCPVIEVHMSNIYRREQFRAHSVLSPVCTGCICGLGVESYLLGLRALYDLSLDIK